MKPITAANVRAFAAHLQGKYKAPIIDQSSPLIHVLEALLELMGLDAIEGSVSKWLSKWSISLRRFVYLCFVPGGRKIPLALQVGILVHEYTHIRRQKKDRRFFVRYIFRSSFRCKYEVEAIKAQMEILHLLGRELTPEVAVGTLRAYGLTKADLSVALKQLRYYHTNIVERGRMAQAVAKVARDWWSD